MSVRCLYLDLDGTLLGRGASLLHDGEGAVSIAGVRAVQACLRAGVEVVLMSGRRRAQVAEDARLLGGDSYIFEAGACLVLSGEEHWLTGALQPGELTIAEHVGTFWLVANAVERDPTLREALPHNVRVAEAGHGAGVYEAVVTTLAEARGAARA